MALLQTIDLKRYFGETRAVDNVNLSIEEREFVSLVGPNGAGKTSLINVISALLAPDSGKIIFKGEDITRLSVTQRVRAGIARSFQLVNVFDDLTAFDNVALAIFSRDGKTAHLGSLAHLDDAVTARPMASSASSASRQTRRQRPRSRPRRAQAAGRGAGLCLEAEAPVPGRADQRRLHPRQGPDHGHHRLGRARRGHHGGDRRARHGRGVQVLRPHRRHGPGRHLAQGTPDEIRKNEQVAMVLLGSSAAEGFTRKD